MDEALIRKAERWAQQHHISISNVIAKFLRQLPDLDQSLELDPLNNAFVLMKCDHTYIVSPSRGDRTQEQERSLLRS